MNNFRFGLFNAEMPSLSNVRLGLFNAELLSLKDGLHDGQTEIPWALVNVNMVLNVHRNRKAY